VVTVVHHLIKFISNSVSEKLRLYQPSLMYGSGENYAQKWLTK